MAFQEATRQLNLMTEPLGRVWACQACPPPENERVRLDAAAVADGAVLVSFRCAAGHGAGLVLRQEGERLAWDAIEGTVNVAARGLG